MSENEWMLFSVHSVNYGRKDRIVQWLKVAELKIQMFFILERTCGRILVDRTCLRIVVDAMTEQGPPHVQSKLPFGRLMLVWSAVGSYIREALQQSSVCFLEIGSPKHFPARLHFAPYP